MACTTRATAVIPEVRAQRMEVLVSLPLYHTVCIVTIPQSNDGAAFFFFYANVNGIFEVQGATHNIHTTQLLHSNHIPFTALHDTNKR